MGQVRTDQFKGAVALILLAGIYGFIGYFGRELAPGLTLWQQLYLRLILATPLLWLTFHKHINPKNCLMLLKKEFALVGLRAFSLFVISVPLFLYATQNAKLGNVAFLQVLPYTFLLGVFINKERLTRAKVGLMAMALVGAYLIAVKSGLDFSHMGRGEVASMISGGLFSLGFVTRKKHKVKANDYEISLTIMAVSTVVVILFSTLVRDGLPQPAMVDARFFVLLLAVSYINSGIILLANYGFQYVRDTLANNIMALEGVFGLVFGFLLYQEVPIIRETFGAFIVLISAVASSYLASKKANEVKA